MALMFEPRDAPPPTTQTVEPGPNRWWALAILALITAAGGALRFFWLDRPVLWWDEVATYSRVTGTFETLMGILQEQGFVPGHYIAYWALGKVTLLDAWSMRLIPAVAGTLFIPAMYFLARQMFDRRVALVAAGFGAASAYALTYSRDAKMYMATWLFVTVSVACLLHFLRSKRKLMLLGWVGSGVLAVMFHATAIIVIALTPLMVPAMGRQLRKRDPVYLVVGLVLIFAGPAWYYFFYNSYIARTGIVAAPTATELDDRERTRWNNSGLQWVEEHNRGWTGPGLTLNSAAGYLLGLQWPGDRHTPDPRGFDRELPPWIRPATSAAMGVVVGLLALGALPWLGLSRRRAETPDDAQQTPDLDPRPPTPGPGALPVPWYRSAWWLGLWLVLPTYGMVYCRSFADFQTPGDWLIAAWGLLGAWWLLALALMAALGAALARWRWAAIVVASGLGLAVAATLTLAAVQGGVRWLPAWGEVLAQPYLLWPVIVAGPAVLWAFSALTLKGRLIKTAQLLALIVLMLGLCQLAAEGWKFLWARHAAEHPDQPWVSIWMPRYLGIVLPAVLAASAALLMRLPTRWLRWSAIGLVIALNLTQGLARIVLDTEPPVDAVARDVWAARGDEAPMLMALNLRDDGGRSNNWFRHWRPNFYLYAEAGYADDTDRYRRGQIRRDHDLRFPVRPTVNWLARRAAQRDTLTVIVVWQRFPSHTPQTDDDPLAAALGDGWRFVGERVYLTRQFWTWREGDWYRRREYQRLPSDVGRPDGE